MSQQQQTVPHERYTETKRKAYGSQQAVAEAWAAGKYPTHNNGTLYSSPNFRGYQHRDGSGELRHYRTTEAIRTHNGLIIDNQQCWAAGFAHCSTPTHVDATLPLTAIGQLLDDEHDVYDITRVLADEDAADPRDSLAIIGSDEYGVAVGYDPSGRGEGNRYFVYRVEPWHIAMAENTSVANVRGYLLTPPEVVASELPVVDAHEYARSRLAPREAAEHERAGGRTHATRSRYSDRRVNRQHYRADLRGNVIVRHGEWFFIPEPTADVPEAGTRYAAERMDNHRAMRFHGARAPLPTECPACTPSPTLDVDEDGNVTCSRCGLDIDRPIYVRGQVSHANGDHNAVHLGETWHRAVRHDHDVLTYSTAPGRGTGRGGWD